MAPQELVVVLPPAPASAGVARSLATARAELWGLEDLCSDLALVVTELVANAVRHAGTEVGVRLVPLQPGSDVHGVRLEVRDGSVRPLAPRESTARDEGGRGLLLVDALCARHGVERDAGGGKIVWAELELG